MQEIETTNVTASETETESIGNEIDGMTITTIANLATETLVIETREMLGIIEMSHTVKESRLTETHEIAIHGTQGTFVTLAMPGIETLGIRATHGSFVKETAGRHTFHDGQTYDLMHD